MLRRRDAKPPRRPRVITWRLVLVSLVVGLVLAVVSVPASLARGALAGSSWHYAHNPRPVIYDGRVYRTYTSNRPTLTLTYVNMYHDAGAVEIKQLIADGMPVRQTDPRPRAVRAWMDTHGGEVTRTSVGWPLRTAYTQTCQSARGWASSQPWNFHVLTMGAWEITAFGRDWTIPYLPLWPGLLGNAVFYGMLLLLCSADLRRRKLRRRAKRGLCLACAYELGEGVTACPECGLARVGA
ncbi:MAG: hypothetical protein HRU13_10225 [Phycisphaerales bacterium]|nr:hypothetical protein [Phycisphaerales bacterium]